jgi:N-acetylglutamate synthase-like GNAT family acetyltransferase
VGQINPIRVVPLGERPDVVPKVATWLYEQWGYFHDHDSVDRRIQELNERLQINELPVAFVALSSNAPDAAPIGTASLTPDDLETRPDLTPWLASVYVQAEHRRAGVGAALVGTVVAHARRLGIETLYLFTEDRTDFYEQLGWSLVGTEIYRGHPVTVMKIAP